ncbi:MAG: lysophospholipase [Deltaproteobacteria bacterium]|nr:lysophospholipase [Deltaproteobacteria bacterium]
MTIQAILPDMQKIHLGQLTLWRQPSLTESTRCRVLIIHGLGEHSGRHSNTISHLCKNGMEVIRFDLRGAGESGGKRQWVEHFEDYVEDVIDVYNWINRSLESMPIFVLGHSLGGTIAIYFAAQYGKLLRGLILSAPAFYVGSSYSAAKIAIGKALVHIVPTLRMKTTSDLSMLSREKRVVDEYENDPLSCHFVTLRQGNEILTALERVPQKLKDIATALLIVHGSLDRSNTLEGSFEIIRKIPSLDKTLHILPGGYHEPHNDLDKEHYFAILTSWIEQRTATEGKP